MKLNQVIVRKFKKSDTIKAGNVVRKAMRPSLVGMTDGEVKKILSRYDPENFLKRIGVASYFVAEDIKSKRILGVIALRKNEVRTFYVDPKHQGEGIGKLLFNRLKEEALRASCKKLITKSSPVAELIYKSLGFKPVKKEWQEINGRRFYNVWMKMKIKNST